MDTMNLDGDGPTVTSVTLDQGKVWGTLRETVARFLAVPYAAAASGDQRWRPPQPLKDAEAGDARRNVALHRCPQPSRPTQTFNGYVLEDDEDCLQLNIWTPVKALEGQDASVPVLFYIHGGGGKCHSAHSPRESGHQLALQQGLCCVNINYRLGILGFLAHPELPSGSGNYAILDQIFALHWIQRNIASFGGDPKNVTIWGLSSGAQYVSTLLVSPAAQGLFHRAMVQSCSDLNNVRQVAGSCDVWLGKTAEDWGCELCQEITGREDRQMEAMHSVPVEQIIRHSISESANDCYEPAIDRRASIKPMSSMEALLAGNFHQVPVLLGVTENDGLGKSELEQTIFCQSEVRSRADLEELFRRDFGENAATVLSHYWPKGVESEARAVHQALSLFSNDLWYFAGTHLMAKLISSSSPVFLYCFAGAKRSMHGSDMASWRGASKSKLSQIMSRYLGNFARYGNPMAMICSQKLQLIFLNGNPCRKLRMNGCF